MAKKTILDEIMRWKRQELPKKIRERPIELVRAQLLVAPPVRPFRAALQPSPAGTPALIAEVKRASPSRGLLRNKFDAVEIASTYAQNGASALSVLTDQHFFQGNMSILQAVRQAVSLPVLRKDFIVDPYQVYEARAGGADALLLIAGILGDRTLRDLLALTREQGMEALVEVHDEAELERALAADAAIIGINNRDLHTFEVDFEATARLRPRVPAGVTVVAESGIRTPEDVRTLGAMGVDAILVGETLVRARDIGAKVRELISYR
ncbi:MAG: indole-3-glycerol phosphate synthase TrpC [Ardenticatenaceae bacterium]|nr:indole-3-glycerol phosphate synthase TrpC [Ardenticatenaceae bacterium]HBY94427.1 indole-3-glycerol phosphate synthase TrpC [Chloroflexota bacterium]